MIHMFPIVQIETLRMAIATMEHSAAVCWHLAHGAHVAPRQVWHWACTAGIRHP